MIDVPLDSPPTARRSGVKSPRGGAGAVVGSGGMEREQKIIYLRQAFCGFFKAKQSVEMEHLGRVICAILGLTTEEQKLVMERITKIAPSVAVNSTLESISSNITSLFA